MTKSPRPGQSTGLQRRALEMSEKALKICDWLPHRGIGYLLCGTPPEKIIFHISDVPPDYLQANGGQAGSTTFGIIPMDADVEFEFAGRYRGRKRAVNLVFPVIRTSVLNFHELGLLPEVVEGAARSLGP
eukprot:s443_g27.t1